VNFFYRKPASPVLSKGGADWPPERLAPSVQGRGQPVPPGIEGSPPAVVTTQEALVPPEAAATEATAVTAAKATVAEATATETAATEATVAEATATETTVAEAVASAAASPLRRGDVHWADHSRDRCRGGGISCRCGPEKHCAGHRACAECAGGDAAGRRE
jgi:hypothetical protein